MSEQQAETLGKIAVGLSGGGFRAAAFHLGTLDVLHAIGCLEDVAALSTVSGGTFVGAAYALAAGHGEPFSHFYLRFYRELQDRPLDKALVYLQDQEVTQLPTPTLIAAHAETYNDVFFRGAQFGAVQQNPSHLREIAFNATDFAAGLPFRFQHSRISRVKIGNGRNWIPSGIAGQIRIADIVAASSCFPGGFEPIRFPNDFVWPDREAVRKDLDDRNPPLFSQSIPLMDGGVADNQGLNSLNAAIERIDRADDPADRIGLILISDVDRPADGPILDATVAPRLGGVRVKHALWFARVLILLAGFTSVLSLWEIVRALYQRDFNATEDLIPWILPLLFALATIAGWSWLRRTVQQQIAMAVNKIGLGPQFQGRLIHFVQESSVSLLLDLIRLRVESLLAMASSVFMKSIRDLRYGILFSDQEHRDHVVANMVYDLAASRYKPARDLPEWLSPTAEILNIGESAKNMATILWFQYPQQLPQVVACGRHTACFNLLTHLVRRYGPEAAGADERTRAVFARAKLLWERFQSDPLLQTEACLDVDR